MSKSLLTKDVKQVTSQQISGQKRSAQNRAQCYYENVKLRKRNILLALTIDKYKKRFHRLQGKVLGQSFSPQCNLHRELKGDRSRISPKMKRKLLFGEALSNDLGLS